MQRKKILWLVSWYPNKNDRFDGDFIQRHARAAAIYHDVHVIFVIDTEMEQEVDEEWNYATGLTEQIIYFKKKRGLAARLRKQWTWKNLYQEAVKKYIEKNGLPDGVHVHIPWKVGLIALWVKRKFGKDFIVAEQWGIYNTEAAHNFYTKPKLMQTLWKRIYLSAKVLETVSFSLSNDVKETIGRSADIVIPNVVDTTLFLPKEGKYSRFSFIHVSNGEDWKNIDKILMAFSDFKAETGDQAQLIVVGNRNSRHVEAARQLGLLNTDVFFKNEVPYKDVAEEMQRCHCHVLFSNFETFSCVTAESLCAGVPVIVPNAGAVVELIRNGHNGYVVQRNSIGKLKDALKKMTENYHLFNPKLIAEEASKKYSYSAIAEKFRQLYDTYC